MRFLSEAKSQDPATDEAIKTFVLFVGGLKVPVTKMEMCSIFEPYGDPSVNEMGVNNRGYVFVELRTTEARAIQACLELSAEEFFGNRLKVEFKDKRGQEHLVAATRDLVGKKLTETRWRRNQNWEREARGEMVGGTENGGGGGGDEDSKDLHESSEGEGSRVRTYQLYVDGLKQPMSNAELAAVLAPYGAVGRLAILDERFFTFVDLETTQARAIACCVELTGREICGNTLRVQFSKKRGQERVMQLAQAAAQERAQMAAASGRGAAAPESSYYSRREDLPAGQLDDDKILPR
jgi:hypothetical protein